MIDFGRPFDEMRVEVEAQLPEAQPERLEVLIWVLIRLVYELAQAIVGG